VSPLKDKPLKINYSNYADTFFYPKNSAPCLNLNNKTNSGTFVHDVKNILEEDAATNTNTLSYSNSGQNSGRSSRNSSIHQTKRNSISNVSYLNIENPNGELNFFNLNLNLDDLKITPPISQIENFQKFQITAFNTTINSQSIKNKNSTNTSITGIDYKIFSSENNLNSQAVPCLNFSRSNPNLNENV